jgi:hypothetical protein
MNHVFSTLANDQLYQNWVPGPGDMPNKARGVLIKGGTGVANDRLITPLGVATEVSDADLQELENNPVFRQHRESGFIVVRPKKADPEKVAADMNMKDKSAPITPAHYETENEDAVKVTLNA